jgi:restriction endonuclease
MRLRFDPELPHQRDAVQAVVSLLHGHPRWDALSDARGLEVDDARLLANLHRLQRARGLPLSPHLCDRNFTVEMETGTGKTYVYLRTAFELFRRHGLSRFIVVVPSVAIKEGVKKTLELSGEHLRALHGQVPFEHRVYDADRLDGVREFARGDGLQLLVINIDAFRRAFVDPAAPHRANLIHRPHDALLGAPPIELLRSARPVVIIDEPQSVDTTPKSREALAALAPLLTLRYSATHRERHCPIHRLGPVEASRRGLVKRIEVAALGPLPSSQRADGLERVRAQLRRTIEEHLARSLRLRPLGIKVLSLFFVDRVARYRLHDAAGASRPGEYARLFEEEYAALASRPEYSSLLGGLTSEEKAARVHDGYFALDRTTDAAGRARFKDSRGRGATAADESAYRLIMRDKERLLSLDCELEYIFSHSALREGWDNPNVFQLCTLGSSGSALRKRQVLGRGLRLAVDQRGERVADPEVNVLTVIASESYEAFARALQTELVAEAETEALPLSSTGDAPPPPKLAPTPAPREARGERPALPREAWIESVAQDLRLAANRLEEPVPGKAQLTLSEDGVSATPLPTRPLEGPRRPLPDVVGLLERSTRLTRRTLVEVLLRSASLDRLERHPERFVEVALAVLTQALSRHGLPGRDR